MLEYLALRLQEVVEVPSAWQPHADREQEFAQALQDALNHMAGRGWTLLSPLVLPGTACLIFSRERVPGFGPARGGPASSTAIQPAE